MGRRELRAGGRRRRQTRREGATTSRREAAEPETTKPAEPPPPRLHGGRQGAAGPQAGTGRRPGGPRPLLAATWAARAAAANPRWPAVCALGVSVAWGWAVGSAAWGLEAFRAGARRAWGLQGACTTLGRPRVVERAPSGRGAVPPPKLLGLVFVSQPAWDTGQASGFSGSAHLRASHQDHTSLSHAHVSLPLSSRQHFIHSVLVSNRHRPLRRELSRSSGVDRSWTHRPRVGAALLAAWYLFG